MTENESIKELEASIDLAKMCTQNYERSQIGVRSGNCRRKQIILLIVIMGDLIKAGMLAWI